MGGVTPTTDDIASIDDGVAGVSKVPSPPSRSPPSWIAGRKEARNADGAVASEDSVAVLRKVVAREQS